MPNNSSLLIAIIKTLLDWACFCSWECLKSDELDIGEHRDVTKNLMTTDSANCYFDTCLFDR